MSHTGGKAKIISWVSQVVPILAMVFTGWQGCSAREEVKLAREEKVSAQEAAKQAKEALCRTLETGFKVIDYPV